jgi:hypothetical protein
VYVQDTDIPIDNNRTEHVLRQQVLGRVNWLFAGSDRGGETAATLYTLVASCKRLRIDPFAYLRDACLPHMTGDALLSELLTDRWIASHPDHRLVDREAQGSRPTIVAETAVLGDASSKRPNPNKSQPTSTPWSFSAGVFYLRKFSQTPRQLPQTAPESAGQIRCKPLGL